MANSKKSKPSPFDPLDNEEKKLMVSLDKGEWSSVPNVKKVMGEHAKIFSNAQKKNKHVNIRMTQSDLDGIRAKAIEEGLPYQTLISSVIHKYISGYLIPRH